MKNTLIAWLFCLPFASCTSPVTQMDLSGQWTVCLDSTDVGMDASFGGKLFDTSITLPGTTDEVHIPEHTRSLSGSLLGYKTIP